MPGLPLSTAPAAAAAVTIRLGTQAAPDDAHAQTPVWTTVIDGSEFAVHRDDAGAHRLRHDGICTYLLSADGAKLTCIPEAPADLRWQRTLLDSVLMTVALLRGGIALHAAAVSAGNTTVAIVAATGGGKSTLAAELLRRGATFVSDDILFVQSTDGELQVHPGPAVASHGDTMPVDTRAISRPLGQIGEETWTQMEQPSRRPPPLGLVVLLERRSGVPTQAISVAATAMDYMPHMVCLPDQPHAARLCFDLAADIALGVRTLRIQADPAVSPSDLAELVEYAQA